MTVICHSKFDFSELWADFASKNDFMSQFCNIAFSFGCTFLEQCKHENPLYYANSSHDSVIINKWRKIVLDIIDKFE